MTKTILLILLSFVGTMNLVGQNSANLIIFTQEPMPFYAIVNGIRQNSEPVTNVKITGLTNTTASVKIVFTNGNTPDVNKNFYFEKMNVEVTARIVNTNKGYKLRYFGEVEMGQAAVNDQQVQIIYQTVEAPLTQTTTVVTEEVTTTTNGDGMTTNGVNMNVNLGENGVNMNVNVTDQGNQNVSTTYTTTTTTTTSSQSENFTEIIEQPIYVAGYTGRIGCAGPISNVNSIQSAIEDEDFSDDKIMVAKQALKGKCLTTDNVVSLIKLFDFEDKKVELAKYAYDYTYDVDNYYKINKAFDFSSSKEELNEYIINK